MRLFRPALSRRAVLMGSALTVLGRSAAAMSKPYELGLVLLDFDRSTGAYPGGIIIRLDEGWKTYWRMPGEAGIPPQFDWSGSSNVAGIDVRFPVPARFSDAGGETVGYKHAVAFPLRVTLRDQAMPCRLQLAMFFAVCKEVCIPAQGSVSFDTSAAASSGPELAILSQSLAELPQAASSSSPIHVSSARLLSNKTLEVAITGASPPANLDVFVEGYDSAYFRAPRLSTPGRYLLAIDGLKDVGALKGRKLRLTISAGDIRLEQQVAVE